MIKVNTAFNDAFIKLADKGTAYRNDDIFWGLALQPIVITKVQCISH